MKLRVQRCRLCSWACRTHDADLCTTSMANRRHVHTCGTCDWIPCRPRAGRACTDLPGCPKATCCACTTDWQLADHSKLVTRASAMHACVQLAPSASQPTLDCGSTQPKAHAASLIRAPRGGPRQRACPSPSCIHQPNARCRNVTQCGRVQRTRARLKCVRDKQHSRVGVSRHASQHTTITSALMASTHACACTQTH